ncbi:hypothetical protein BCR32DRAFT_223775 [Anaeromyces robustus]|uniref:CBM10 domain-containing protein n=1 Tax=Anaeromyces robustus TaxID=1754192 RepID=A0A1Y1WU73_9FUNG|nr:hypothetical protein BCR32DRAFT_223775 [Anaeromyces robustus]|eukprot:ORX76992.1 hypothetical protein BCR32DRAFT_223775 [Anaeromyces robustus]
MLFKLTTILNLAVVVSAVNTFVGDYKRAELFEKTDDLVPIFRVTIPENDYNDLIEDVNTYDGPGAPPPGPGLPPPLPKNSPVGPGGPGAPGGPMDLSLLRTEEPDGYKTKNAVMDVEFGDEVKSFKKVTFSVGGSSSRHFSKQGFNIKIRGNQNLYGRTQLRLRPDVREATLLRTKLACDIQNRLGLPSVSANYAKLYLNDIFMGFYVLTDSIKLSWVESVFGEKDTTDLIQCGAMENDLSYEYSIDGCTNLNDDVTDNTEWGELLKAFDNAQSIEDVEDFFDVDTFLKNIAFEYLTGSWDHYLNYGHNFYLFRPAGDKWKFLLYDFDGEFGQDLAQGVGKRGAVITDYNYARFPFNKWHKDRHLLDILIYKNSTRFDNILKQEVIDAFNPAVVFPHIDELKKFIKPYIIEDYTPDENGQLPGRINLRSQNRYNLTQWDANCEFTTVLTTNYNSAYGLKMWFLERYRFVCKEYNMDCDEKYLDENFETPIDKSVEVPLSTSSRSLPPTQPEDGNGNDNSSSSQPPSSTDTTITTTITDVENPTNQPNEKPAYNCWVEQFGYPCCQKNAKVYAVDDEGEWGYNFKTQEWCGITPYSEKQKDEECWSEVFGYPCCQSCYVYEEDENGKWGYDFNESTWCGIQSYCKI